MSALPFAEYIPNFLFILLRTGIFVSFMPFFGSNTFPPSFRIGIAVAIAVVLTPVVKFQVAEAGIPMMVFHEVVFAMALGLSVRFVFWGVDMAGQAISNSMGLAMATVFDPEFGQTADIARLKGAFAMLIFFALDVHHDIIYIFVRGFDVLPMGKADVPALMQAGVDLASRLFVMTVKLAAPVMVGLLSASVVFGFVSKAVPSMNILFISFPVYIFVGFVILLLSVPIFTMVLGGYFEGVKEEMSRIIAIAGG